MHFDRLRRARWIHQNIIGDPFGGSTTWEPPVLVDELQSLLLERAEHYATAISGELSAEVGVVWSSASKGRLWLREQRDEPESSEPVPAS